MSKVVVISTSLRPGSNSHMLAEQFAEGAKSAGHEVELISLRGKEIKFCIGCFGCQRTGACVFKDDVPAIMESVLNADVVCWATPIEKAALKAHLFCGGVNDPREIAGNAKLQEAYELGKSI